MLNLKEKKLKAYNRVYAALSMVMLPVWLVLLMSSAGCAALKRPIIHPLEDDFHLTKANQPFTPLKDGAFISNYFMCKVMGVDIDGLACKDVR